MIFLTSPYSQSAPGNSVLSTHKIPDGTATPPRASPRYGLLALQVWAFRWLNRSFPSISGACRPEFSGGRFAPESSSSRPLVTLPAPMRLDRHGVCSQVCCAVFLNTSFLVGSTNPGPGGYHHHAEVGDPESERPASSAGAGARSQCFERALGAGDIFG